MLGVLRSAVVTGKGPSAAQWVLRSSWVALSWLLLYHAKLNISHIHIYRKYICIFAAISHMNAPWGWKEYAGYMPLSAMVESTQTEAWWSMYSIQGPGALQPT